MNLIIFVLLLCFFIFLYILYYISKDDFVIIRKDISMERIFSMAIFTSLSALFFSRFFYVLINPSPAVLNPLGFLAFPYFPGLSLIGAVVGAEVFIYFYCSYKKLPTGKIFDLVIMSFIGVLPVGFILTYLILLGKTTIFFNVFFFISLFLLILFAKILYPFSIKGEIKDGSLGFIFTAIFSFLYFLTNLFLNIKSFSFLDFQNLFVFIVLFSSLILLINQEIMNKFLSKK